MSSLIFQILWYSEYTWNFKLFYLFYFVSSFSFSFGKRIGGAARRHNECLILEPSEMIVVRNIL